MEGQAVKPYKPSDCRQTGYEVEGLCTKTDKDDRNVCLYPPPFMGKADTIQLKYSKTKD